MKPNITLFLHDEKNKCQECLETSRLFEKLGKNLKKKAAVNRVEDNSFEEIFMNERLPVLRVEGIPPKHYGGLQEIRDYISGLSLSKYLSN